MKHFISILFLSLVFQTCFGQTTIRGRITDSLGVVKNANILNVSSKVGTNSNEDGLYRLAVKLGDTIQISTVQHDTKNLIVANITLKNKELDIFLKLKVYELEEFELKQHDLLGSLSIDLNAVPVDNTPTFDAVSLGLPNAGNRKMTQIERKIYTATTGNGIIPIDLVINILSGRLKRLKEEARLIDENNDVEYMYRNYRFFIQDYYGISEDDLYRFLYFCTSDPTFKRSLLKNEIAMIGFLKSMADVFKGKSQKNQNVKIGE